MQTEAVGGCEQGRGLFIFCKIAWATLRRKDMGGRGVIGSTVRNALGRRTGAWRLRKAVMDGCAV